MRATLLHNPDAGDGSATKAELRDALRAAGFDIRYHNTHDDDVERALREPADLVVVAGGDGAVGKVAFAYADMKEYDKAIEHAKAAYALGHPLPGLRDRLKRAGKWVD